jgi:hypothetical protein
MEEGEGGGVRTIGMRGIRKDQVKILAPFLGGNTIVAFLNVLIPTSIKEPTWRSSACAISEKQIHQQINLNHK